MKTCTKCDETKPYSEFTRKKIAPDGYFWHCRDCKNEAQRAYRGNRGGSSPAYNRLRLYGITEDEYNDLLEKQEGKCAICGKFRKLHVDHDHDSGRVRGLLCPQCNQAIGLLQEDTEVLMAAVSYLISNQYARSLREELNGAQCIPADSRRVRGGSVRES